MTRIALWGGARKAIADSVRHERSSGKISEEYVQSGSLPGGKPGSDLTGEEAAVLLKSYEESGQGWFWATDAAGNVTYLTDRIAPLLIAERQIPAQTSFCDLFQSGNDDSGPGRTLPFLFAKKSRFYRLILQSVLANETRWWSISGVPQFDRDGAFAGYRGSGIDITEHRLSSEHASRLAMYDSLTGLGTRLRMAQVLEQNLAKFAFHRRPCTVMLIDLDRFKQVNDTLGHPAGDALLKQVAERLLGTIGDRECIFRLGGDEFQIIMRDVEDRDALETLAERIIASLSQPYSVDGSRCIIGASIGVAIAPHDGLTAEDLIRNADLALYAAKAAGRGCARFFSSDFLEAAEERRHLEEDLRDALARGELEVFYQPLVSAGSNRTTGVEALVRWHHPDRGAVSPAVFIPIAEDINLIGQLGEWVLRQACADAASWSGDIRVAVNVSPMQFTSGSFPALVMSALANSGLSANRLELEITEGVFLSESAEVDATFKALKDIGVRLALDDFGTGYSSLGYLRTAPFDKIKIDQSFVRAATLPGSRNAAIIKAIVALAEALGMETTAEGIETEDQLELIRTLRVSHVQGYIYSKPIPNADLQERLASGQWIIEPCGPARQRSERISMFRKVGAIFGNHYRSVLIRNLSETGALIEGLDDVSVGSQLIIDFGQGQLAFARVRRSRNRQQGIEFDEPLVSDGEGGFRTTHRISAYTLRAAGLPVEPAGSGAPAILPDNSTVIEAFRAKLGLKPVSLPSGLAQTVLPIAEVAVAPLAAAGIGEGAALQAIEAAGGTAQRVQSGGGAGPTVMALAQRHLDSIGGNRARREADHAFLVDHILPNFGHLPVEKLTPSTVADWLAAKADDDEISQSALDRLQTIMGQLYVQAIQWGGGAGNGDGGVAATTLSRRAMHDRHLTREEIDRLKAAVDSSANQQLKFLVALLMVTGVRQRDLLEACWDHFDLDAGMWFIASAKPGRGRYVRLSPVAVELIRKMPRWDNCPYLIANPKTKRPYRSFASSWQTVRTKADLPDVEIDDLRNCVEIEANAGDTWGLPPDKE